MSNQRTYSIEPIFLTQRERQDLIHAYRFPLASYGIQMFQVSQIVTQVIAQDVEASMFSFTPNQRPLNTDSFLWNLVDLCELWERNGVDFGVIVIHAKIIFDDFGQFCLEIVHEITKEVNLVRLVDVVDVLGHFKADTWVLFVLEGEEDVKRSLMDLDDFLYDSMQEFLPENVAVTITFDEMEDVVASLFKDFEDQTFSNDSFSVAQFNDNCLEEYLSFNTVDFEFPSSSDSDSDESDTIMDDSSYYSSDESTLGSI